MTVVTWENLYLFCFAFGFLFSLVAVLGGHLGLHGGHDSQVHGHPGGQLHGPGHDVHFHPSHGHGGAGHGTAGHDSHAETVRSQVSPLNMGTLAAFLAWFGGAGYLTTRMYAFWVVTTLAIAIAAGIAGATIIFLFLSRVLMREREDLDPADYGMIGVLGKVSGSIREHGLGEIIFTQAGCRRAVSARSEDAIAIPSGTDVVVVRFENGIASVRRWEDFTGRSF